MYSTKNIYATYLIYHQSILITCFTCFVLRVAESCSILSSCQHQPCWSLSIFLNDHHSSPFPVSCTFFHLFLFSCSNFFSLSLSGWTPLFLYSFLPFLFHHASLRFLFKSIFENIFSISAKYCRLTNNTDVESYDKQDDSLGLWIQHELSGSALRIWAIFNEAFIKLTWTVGPAPISLSREHWYFTKIISRLLPYPYSFHWISMMKFRKS